MAKLSFAVSSWTPIAVADSISFTANAYQCLQGGTSSQRTKILEVYMGGQASSSSPTLMILGHDSLVGVTPSVLAAGQSAGPLDPASAPLVSPVVAFTTASTQPQRSPTAGRLNLSFNAFGGIVRWVAAPDEEFWMVGNSASSGETSLTAYTGGTPGLMGSHIIYESL